MYDIYLYVYMIICQYINILFCIFEKQSLLSLRYKGMKTKSKTKFSNNPLLFSNSKTEALDDALVMFLEAFNDYALKNNLTEDQINSFKEQILSAYLERQATYFFENKIEDITDYIIKSFSFALTKKFKNDEKDNFTKFLYYNNKHSLIKHEY